MIALGIFAGFLLFGPESLLQKLGVAAFAQTNRSWLGLTLIGTVALFLVSGFADLIKWVRGWRFKRTAVKHMRERLHHLTEDEKQILRYYIAEQTRANMLRIDDGVVQGLAAESIILLASRTGTLLGGFAYNISGAAWDYLKANPGLLVGTTNTYRNDDLENPLSLHNHFGR